MAGQLPFRQVEDLQDHSHHSAILVKTPGHWSTRAGCFIRISQPTVHSSAWMPSVHASVPFPDPRRYSPGASHILPLRPWMPSVVHGLVQCVGAIGMVRPGHQTCPRATQPPHPTPLIGVPSSETRKIRRTSSRWSEKHTSALRHPITSNRNVSGGESQK